MASEIQQRITFEQGDATEWMQGCATKVITEWNDNETKTLIDLYKKYRCQVGSMQVRNMKKLWELIASQINNIFRTHYTYQHVENRWRVVERNYKKFVDNNNKTGRGRKMYAYEKEMDELFGKKKNLHPELLLSSSSPVVPQETSNKSVNVATYANESSTIRNNGQEVISLISVNEPLTSIAAEETQKVQKNKKPKRTPKQTRTVILNDFTKCKKEFYREYLEIQKERVNLKREKIRLIKERNEILKRCVDNQINIPE